MDKDLISITGRRHDKYSLWIIAAMALFALVGMNICGTSDYVGSLVVCVMFSLVSSIAYGAAWRAAARRPETLTRFYLAASAVRMLCAILVVVVFCALASNRDAIIAFTVAFVAFYVVIMAFDGVFFVRFERNVNKKGN